MDLGPYIPPCCQQVLLRLVRIEFPCPADGHSVSASGRDVLWHGLFGAEFSGQAIVLALLVHPFMVHLASKAY